MMNLQGELGNSNEKISDERPFINISKFINLLCIDNNLGVLLIMVNIDGWWMSRCVHVSVIKLNINLNETEAEWMEELILIVIWNGE